MCVCVNINNNTSSVRHEKIKEREGVYKRNISIRMAIARAVIVECKVSYKIRFVTNGSGTS